MSDLDPELIGALGIGVLLVVMGIFAILAPFLASVAINAWIGVAFLLAGIAQVAQSFGRGGWREALGHLLIGAVYILGALLVIFNPLAGLMAFSLVIVIMLAVSGIVRIVEGLRMNEDTFSLRLMDENENLWAFSKGRIRSYDRIETSTMPSVDGMLTANEVDDLVAYLFSLRREES